MRRAAKVDDNHPDIVDALRAVGAAVLSLARLGDGAPDLLIGHRGSKRLGLLEVKDGDKYPSRRKLKDKQIEFFDAWQGFPLGMVQDVDGALRFYRMLGSPIQRLEIADEPVAF